VLSCTRGKAATPDFRFDRDTFAFTNDTVFEYSEGHAHARKLDNQRPKPFTRRCFVLCRTAMQFRKFARFDPHSAPLDDKQLAARIREVTRRSAWREHLPPQQQVVFPGYADLHTMSMSRRGVVQENIGLGWPSYFRLGNFRMFYKHDRQYQEQTHANLDATLARGELFVAYLSTYPKLSINHAVLVYARKPTRAGEIERYIVYDPNHLEAPRELVWSSRQRAFSYEKDWDFVGGFTRVYQVYGKPLQ
jgi:hypothetical protein